MFKVLFLAFLALASSAPTAHHHHHHGLNNRAVLSGNIGLGGIGLGISGLQTGYGYGYQPTYVQSAYIAQPIYGAANVGYGGTGGVY